ncbi:MAG: proprotein convertase P-domain-containing protein [Bacteroidetes bacterium]|nr:proprotein convertase P-domain-containing protein [Bacteroidota bacterium]
MKQRYFLIILILNLLLLSCQNSYSFMFWNQAGGFSGTASSYISVPHSASLNITGSFSAEAWIFPVNSLTPSSQIILEKRTGVSSNGYTFFLNNGKVAVRTNSAVRLIGNTVIQNNAWTHIAGTYDNVSNTFSIYVNGILDTSAVVSNSDPVTNTDSVRIGKGNGGSPFHGLMDELRLWNKALAGAEVYRYRRTTLGSGTGNYSGLIMSFTFQDNESAGTDFSLNDWSGNSNNGKNTGVTPVDLSSRPSNTIALNECLELDGVNDHASGADNSAVSPVSAVTMEAWIFPQSISGIRTLIHKGPATGGTANYALRLNGNILNAVINNNISFNASTSIILNVWTHVAFSYDGSNGKFTFYINGRKAGEGVLTLGSVVNGPDSLYIGGLGTSGSSFDGFIDEVRISNYVKPQALINRFLYQSIDQANKPNSGQVNVVYNLDGYAYDNSDTGPVLNLVSGADFSHSGAVDNQPVSPLNRADNMNFQQGFMLKTSNKRIPETGITGYMTDSIEICIDTLITDVNLFVALNHTDETELKIYLVAPNGDSVSLFANQSLVANADNIVTIFDDQADSSVSDNFRFVSYAPVIKPRNSMNSLFNGKFSAGTWKLRIKDETGSGAGRLCAWGLQFNNMSMNISSLCLRVFMEGFYRPVDSCIVDTIKVRLHESTSPYPEVGVKGETPDDNTYIGNYSFISALPGTEYYIEVEHRNSVETWSAHTVSFDFLSSGLEYDFTHSKDSAYGSNETKVENIPLRYAIYGGDTNRDGITDASDVGAVDNDASISASGYVITDLTGDNFVDANDISISDNNSSVPVIAITPP